MELAVLDLIIFWLIQNTLTVDLNSLQHKKQQNDQWRLLEERLNDSVY